MQPSGPEVTAIDRENPVALLLVGTSYPQSLEDWKGLFIRHMVDALAHRADIELSSWLPPGELAAGVEDATSPDDRHWLGELMDAGGIAHLLRRRPLHGLNAGRQLLQRLRRAYARSDASLFHVNWLQNALALPRDGRPALVTALGTDMQMLRLPGMRVLLRRAFKRRPVTLCPNADWMVEPLERAFGDVARVQALPFGIDRSWYQLERGRPADGIDRWLCVTRLTAAKLGPLFDWGRVHFQRTARELHLFGPMQESTVVPDWIHFHGPASPEQLRRDWFPNACGLISLSRHAEGRPQVMLEAMAAGLPILASRLPAHEDIVAHAQTGWLCDDPDGFAAGITAIEDPMRNTDMGRHAREWARSNIGDWDDCAARYAAEYQQLLARRSR